MKIKDIIDKDIVKIEVPYFDFNDYHKTGFIEVHHKVKDDVYLIFKELESIKFPIFSIKTIDNFNFSDEESVRANNTSSYNFRFVAGTNKLSDHAIGLAIDINPLQNPWVHPSALNISKYDVNEKGTILDNSEVVEIFKKYGWSWGGHWKNPDYQHFFKGGDINKGIKNKLYSDSGVENPYLKNVPKSRLNKFTEFVKRFKI